MKDLIAKHKLDVIIIGSLITVAAALLLVFSLASKPGSYVEITVDGELYGVYSLSEDREIDINGANLLIIEGGKAYMKEASCPNHTCISRGAVSKSGQSIICLPNKVVVTVKGDRGGADAVSS